LVDGMDAASETRTKPSPPPYRPRHAEAPLGPRPFCMPAGTLEGRHAGVVGAGAVGGAWARGGGRGKGEATGRAAHAVAAQAIAPELVVSFGDQDHLSPCHVRSSSLVASRPLGQLRARVLRICPVSADLAGVRRSRPATEGGSLVLRRLCPHRFRRRKRAGTMDANNGPVRVAAGVRFGTIPHVPHPAPGGLARLVSEATNRLLSGWAGRDRWADQAGRLGGAGLT
jgi:hypothetical protein